MGRVGDAPDETNRITRDGSIALFGHGLLDARPYDSFGAGLYSNGPSDRLKGDHLALTGGAAKVKNEAGMEVFYDLAITPAVRLITRSAALERGHGRGPHMLAADCTAETGGSITGPIHAWMRSWMRAPRSR